MPDGDRLRVELIRRICQLPAPALPDVEQFLKKLESTPSKRDDPAPLCLSQKDALNTSPYHWPHAPLHRLSEHGTFIVTARTLHKEHLFRGRERLDLLESRLLTLAKQYGVHLEAWAVFSNHYHFVGHSTGPDNQIKSLISHLHSKTGTDLNTLDRTPGREVWHNFWDTQLTFEKSYLARLNYVHQNAVKHGLVSVANQYPWCSAPWFELTATTAKINTIYSFKIDKLKVHDDFEPV